MKYIAETQIKDYSEHNTFDVTISKKCIKQWSAFWSIIRSGERQSVDGKLLWSIAIKKSAWRTEEELRIAKKSISSVANENTV